MTRYGYFGPGAAPATCGLMTNRKQPLPPPELYELVQLKVTADVAGWLTSPDASSARRVRALRTAWASPSLLK